MKTFLLRLRLFWRALTTTRPLYWTRMVWHAKSFRGRDRAVAEYGEPFVKALDEAMAILDAHVEPVPEIRPYYAPRGLS